VAITHRQLNAR